MLNVGDLVVFKGYSFRVYTIKGARVGLAYCDVHGVEHIKWVPQLKLLQVLRSAA